MNNTDTLETMNDFFSRRIDTYDEHMLSMAKLRNAYTKMANLIPLRTKTILDLGCGTGLELNEIFRIIPDIAVTGIDMNHAMLEKTKAKYADKTINTICADYRNYDFGNCFYDAAISFETMHHLTHEEKIKVYKSILNSLKSGGRYIECDYMVSTQTEEDNFIKEYEALKQKCNVDNNELYHFDIPCTIENEMKLFSLAGFQNIEQIWNEDQAVILVGEK
jgi:SAM-dependent methyltransferase